ncbi:hypothetical protein METBISCDRAFT_28685 [Metschnikowia bicuspidata]|uniref:Uncharacterized protein n=1 Tax=Metschnikowia bicuspidata TaxID=27322 RepID=A0A4P9Z884_9ASCO|nr:hypothetical protein METBISCDRAFT_28685 [Metschnikowia bicuspidata]
MTTFTVYSCSDINDKELVTTTLVREIIIPVIQTATSTRPRKIEKPDRGSNNDFTDLFDFFDFFGSYSDFDFTDFFDFFDFFDFDF